MQTRKTKPWLVCIAAVLVVLMFLDAEVSAQETQKHYGWRGQILKPGQQAPTSHGQTGTSNNAVAVPDAVGAPQTLPQVAGPDTTGAGTVRVNNLANLEAALNILANAGESLGITIGGPMFLLSFVLWTLPDRRKLGWVFLVLGIVFLACGLALPGIINWLVASMRDAKLFS